MRKWKCTICGYIFDGNLPPEKCPVCGSPRNMFVEDIIGLEQGIKVKSYEADVIVVGTGAAAFSSAITARANGLSVIMLEKASSIGGTTARSGGGFWIPNNRHQREAGIIDNRESCIKYMARYSYPNLYNPNDEKLGLPNREFNVISSYYDNASKMVDFLENSGAMKTIMEINWTGKPQVDYMDHLPENKGIRGRTIYTQDESGKLAMGANLIKVLSTWAVEHDISIYTDYEVTKILTGINGEVIGVEASYKGEKRNFTAHSGVIFGSGGYSHNSEFMLRFQRGPHYGGCSVPTNTGDFIKLAGEIGAAIGNTASAFRAQSMIEVYLKQPSGSSNVFFIPGDSVIEVNKYGKRIVDEKRNYTDRTMIHFVWDGVKAEWTNMLVFMIFDERTATMWQGHPPYPIVSDDIPHYIIKGENLVELTSEISKHLGELSAHTGGFSLDESFLQNLKDTINKFNNYAKTGKDLEFNRGDYTYDKEWTTFPPTMPNVTWPDPDSPNYTMHAISEVGPYYAVILGAGTLDTNGGPIIDEHGRVLRWDGTPIKGLYGAGNCIASPTANAYWGGGSTIGPGMTFGYLSAMDITKG